MDFTQKVRIAIYEMTVDGERVPSVEELAAARGLNLDRVASAYRALADAHVIVLSPRSMNVWSAPPFSAVPTPFRVRQRLDSANGPGAKSWYAPCAWDAFGIPAVVKQDVTIDASCPESGEALRCGVEAGRAVGSGIIHLEVPARRFWDDIFYT